MSLEGEIRSMFKGFAGGQGSLDPENSFYEGDGESVDPDETDEDASVCGMNDPFSRQYGDDCDDILADIDREMRLEAAAKLNTPYERRLALGKAVKGKRK